MKTHNTKWIAISLAIILLLQSCSVYKKSSAPIDEAVISHKKVLVTNYSEAQFKFDYLTLVNDQLYGITNRNSKTAKSLAYQTDNSTSNRSKVKILLPTDTIKSIQIHDRSLSTILTVGGILVSITTIGLAALVLFQDDDPPEPMPQWWL